MARDGTAIWVSRDVRRRLEKLKLHRREGLGDVVKRLLDAYENPKEGAK